MKRILLALVMAAGLSAPLAAQTVSLGAGGGPGPVEIVVNGKPYVRVDKDGVMTMINGGVLQIPAGSIDLSGTATTVPFFASDGSLTYSTGFFWDPVAEKLNILGGVTANNGPLLVTRKATGGNPVLASGISVYRNSQYGGGTPTANDITNAEFLLQAADNLWYAVGAVGGKITGITDGAVAGGTILYCKPAGAFALDNTVPCAFLSGSKTLRVGDGNVATSMLELHNGTFTLSSPSITAHETLAVRPQLTVLFPANPTGTASTTDVMMGSGSTLVFTPRQSGNVRIQCDFMAANSVSGSGFRANLYRGTGTAPANGDAVTGTQTGGAKVYTASANGAQTFMSLNAVATGLTLATQYWFDFAVRAVTSGTASMITVSCIINEY